MPPRLAQAFDNSSPGRPTSRTQLFRASCVTAAQQRLSDLTAASRSSNCERGEVAGTQVSLVAGRDYFRRLLEQAIVTAPVTEADVTCGYDW